MGRWRSRPRPLVPSFRPLAVRIRPLQLPVPIEQVRRPASRRYRQDRCRHMAAPGSPAVSRRTVDCRQRLFPTRWAAARRPYGQWHLLVRSPTDLVATRGHGRRAKPASYEDQIEECERVGLRALRRSRSNSCAPCWQTHKPTKSASGVVSLDTRREHRRAISPW